jgi:hypothetical protein
MQVMIEQLAAFPTANPWHICFAFGLYWGHLADLDTGFTGAVVRVLENWDDADLKVAQSYQLERGPQPIMQSLAGAKNLFGRVTLPQTLPTTLKQLERAQERWLTQILNPKERPRYIGAWNATAMFMAALFANRELATTQVSPPPMLPPSGAIHAGLTILHEAGVTGKPSAGRSLDDAAFEPGAIYENNGILGELCAHRRDWCLIDVHSGVYALGTRDRRSDASI